MKQVVLLISCIVLFSCFVASKNISNDSLLGIPSFNITPSKLHCYVCKELVTYVDDATANNKTYDAIKEVWDDACKLIPNFKNLSYECYGLANEYSSYIINMLEEEYTPDDICDGIRVCAVNQTAPQFAHLALTGNIAEMSVTWLTFLPTSNPLVKWSHLPVGDFGSQATAVSSTYLPKSGYNHKAVMNNLKPDTKYYYIVGDEEGGWSKVFSFKTEPATQQPFSIAMYGDQGVHNSQTTMERIRDLVSKQQLDWIYHVGDVSYADDYLGNIYNYVWDEWFGTMEIVTSAVPYMMCPGNHEHSCKHPECMDYSVNFTAYNNRFRMPGEESGSNTNMYFSFDYSFVHFVSISSETDYPNCPYDSQFGDQLTWLKQDLEKANSNRYQVPWIIVVGHRPMYSSAQGHSVNGIPVTDSMNLQAAFEEIFYNNKVDLYVSGHVHSYERIFPIFQDKVVAKNYNSPQATVHLVSGAGGCIEELSFWGEYLPDWSAARYNSDQGYGVLKVYNSSTLQWQFFSSGTNTLQDSIILQRGF